MTRRCRCDECRSGREMRRRKLDKCELETGLRDAQEFLDCPYYPWSGPIERLLVIRE